MLQHCVCLLYYSRVINSLRANFQSGVSFRCVCFWIAIGFYRFLIQLSCLKCEDSYPGAPSRLKRQKKSWALDVDRDFTDIQT
jgi:hypothetical protein